MSEIKIPKKLLVQLRQLLHKHPELSGKENETATRIAGFLKSYNPTKLIEGIGGHGIAAVYQYYTSKPTILIRCELDALPIDEKSNMDYKSVNPGVAHKCGHDGHMAIVAGLAAVLNKNRPKRGRVVLLFQPEEEEGAGAQKVLNDKKFRDIKPDYVFSMHNLPGYAKNEVICKAGNFTAAATSVIIKLQGKTSHAAEPENGVNPALAIAEIIQECHKLEQRELDESFTLITPIQIEMGEESYGTSAGYGEIKLTLRTWDNEKMEDLVSKTEKLFRKVGRKYQLKVALKWLQSFASNQNDKKMVAVVEKAAADNKLKFIRKEKPFRWGEDFGLFTDKYKGAMFCLGAGKNTPPLHSDDYDFPDDIIPTAIKIYASIIEQILK